VGETSAGSTLPSTILKLPTGALFQYAIGNYQTADGVVLEGRGVVPDTIVPRTRRLLLTRGDTQLAVALGKLRARIHPPLKDLIADVTVTNSAKVAKPTATPAKVVADDPPPVRQMPPAENVTKADDENARLTKDVIDRYIEALGGEPALLKITNRVSTGSIELPTGLTGTIEVYEAAPNRSSVFMNLNGFGTIQETFDGKVQWMQDPVRGYLKISENSRGEEFQRELSLRKQLADLRFDRKEKLDDQNCIVLARSVMGRVVEHLYFSAETGLLLREGDLYFEDYREVDGVKIPFIARQNGTRGNVTVIRLTSVRQNVTIDESKFAERSDCFTKPEGGWR
jgi:hypothetical protein